MGRADTGKGTDGQTWSLELCGGTHVARTGDIGLFVALSDSASSAGVRRIEGLTGAAALKHLAARAGELSEIAGVLKAPVAEIVARVKALSEERRALANEVAQLKRELAMGGGQAATEARQINGLAFVSKVMNGVSGKDLPALIDAHKAQIGSGAVLLIAGEDGKASVAAGVTADLTDRISAVALVKAAVEAMGGKGGGGRPDLAQGGAKDIAAADAAIAAAEAVLAG
jgi:alanyl-tRNA synthetase